MSGRNEGYLLPIDCVTFIKLVDDALGNLNCLSTKVAAGIAHNLAKKRREQGRTFLLSLKCPYLECVLAVLDAEPPCKGR
jgi:hypothetical protein